MDVERYHSLPCIHTYTGTKSKMRKWDLQALMTDVFICECGATLTTRITAQRRLYSSQICLIGFSSIMLLHCTVPWAAVEDGEVRGGGEALSSWVIWLFPWGVCGIHFTRSNLGDQLRLGVWYSVADLRQYGLYMCKKWSKRWEWKKKKIIGCRRSVEVRKGSIYL